MSKKSFLNFVLVPSPSNTKTLRFEVRNTLDNELLGKIGWRPGWRKYVFRPMPDIDWSDDCLRDLAAYLKHIHKERVQ